jgi:glucose/arabinose dehydrogenase
MRLCLRIPLAVVAALVLAPPARALPPGYTLELVHPNLSFPVALRIARDGRLFYIEKNGNIMVFANVTATTPSVWATVAVNTDGERGLLGLALHPLFPDSPYVYVYHTNPDPLVNRVIRLADGGGVGLLPRVMVDNLPAGSLIHNGGRLVFGPDGMLYVSYGDQSQPGLAPDPNQLPGKILRVTSLGQPAPGNPWGPGNPAFAMGIRNVFGLCFDPVTGEGYFTDNGPSCDDKVAHLSAGADYGWRLGASCGVVPSGTMPPMLTYSPTIAPTGCTVYRNALDPGLSGWLLFGSFNDGIIRRAHINHDNPGAVDAEEVFLDLATESILDVIVDGGGLVWLCTPGAIYRILPPGVPLGVGGDARTPRFAVRPNPFTSALAFSAAPGSTLARVEILDAAGRRVRAWHGPVAGTLTWDGTDEHGSAVPAGVYLVRAFGAGGAVTRRVVRLASDR